MADLIPTDADYDDMHHALGRPRRAHDETYRNHYAIEPESNAAKRFMALGWWNCSCEPDQICQYAIYSVNDAGKQALAEWLEKRDSGK